MRRTITVIAAAIAAMFSAGVASAAVGEQVPVVVPEGLKVSEVATAQGVGPAATFREFIELQNVNDNNPVSISGVKVFAKRPGLPEFLVAQIPFGTPRLQPGQTYLLASASFQPGPIQPDLYFTTQTDIPEVARITLKSRYNQTFETANITAARALTPSDIMARKSLHRTACVTPAWQKFGATPGIPESITC